MAIKGKGKARVRSGRRVIAAPPRPQMMVRKPPIWKRRWVWGLVAALAVAGIVIGVVLTLRASHQRSFKAKEAAALSTVAHQLIAKFPKDRQESPGNFFVLYPSFSGDLDGLAKNKLKATDAVARGTAMSTTAQASQQGLNTVPVNTLIPESFTVSPTPGVAGKGATRQALTDARFLMGQAFQLYQEAGKLLASAAGSTGKARSDLIDQARQVYGQAGALFDQGLRKILTTADALGSPLTLTSTRPVRPLPTPSSSPQPNASASP